MFRTHSTLARRGFSAWVLGVALVLASVTGPQAQEVVGAIEGAVKDSSGAVLPGATVELTGPVGALRAVSNNQGEFRFPRVPSGRYKVMVTLSGFAARESNVEVNPLRVTITL